MISRQALIEGGESGDPAIRPDRSDVSPLIEFVMGSRKKLEMPPLKASKKYPALSEQEISKLRAWIDQGAHSPANTTINRPKKKGSGILEE